MNITLSHEFVDESLSDKTRWFSSLSVAERIAWLDEWTEIILQNNPDALKKFHHDNTFNGSICRLRKKHG
ncbi:MAG: hypothetical protein GY801_13320 [bacterium]|nr:hypothetical protein [bacterium]